MPPASWDTNGSVASFNHATCILRYQWVSSFILSFDHILKVSPRSGCRFGSTGCFKKILLFISSFNFHSKNDFFPIFFLLRCQKHFRPLKQKSILLPKMPKTPWAIIALPSKRWKKLFSQNDFIFYMPFCIDKTNTFAWILYKFICCKLLLYQG
jgi:hypothetical protein